MRKIIKFCGISRNSNINKLRHFGPPCVCVFCIIVNGLYCKTSIDTSVFVKNSAVLDVLSTDNLCTGVLLVSIANNSIFLILPYVCCN